MYAPIIIPTLNRIKHLKRCIESLQRNKEACNTEIYISVDYPPSKKYEDGYEDVKSYVNTITGFKSVNSFFQNENLGPGLNSRFLLNEARKKYDCFIFSEDDNEFSRDFLQYMNWGLEKYANDKEITAICSTSDFEIIANEKNADYLMIQAYNAYGTGQWFEKYDHFLEYLKNKNVNDIYRSKKTRDRLFQFSPMIYRWVALDSLRKVSVMRNSTDGLTSVDIWRNVYCIENNYKCVIPIIPKSRNWGKDGTGIHASKDQSTDYVPPVEFCDNQKWPETPVCLSEEEIDDNIISHSMAFSITKLQRMKSSFLYKINAIFGNNTVLTVYNMLRKIYHIVTNEHKNESQEIKYV